MDDTIKVIIATLSGFVIAFLSEPVKSYFQNRTKLHNLRVALYKEMGYNDILLGGVTPLDLVFPSPNQLRRECYDHALQNEISLFYQLEEASKINLLQGHLLVLVAATFQAEGVPPIVRASQAKLYQEIYAQSFVTGNFDCKILKKLSPGGYEEIIERGKKCSEQIQEAPHVE